MERGVRDGRGERGRGVRDEGGEGIHGGREEGGGVGQPKARAGSSVTIPP